MESAAETSQEYEQSFAVLIERLDELTGLADSWFDDASTAPSAESVELAREIAAALQSDGLPAPIAFPTPHGGISLEWIVEPLQIGVAIQSGGATGELSPGPPVFGGGAWLLGGLRRPGRGRG